jgi:hypothetical protein
MRSLTTAIEAYNVDQNCYPLLSSGPVTEANSYGAATPWLTRLIPLTTPVAYITTIPIDPFTHDIDGNGDAVDSKNPLYTCYVYSRGDMDVNPTYVNSITNIIEGQDPGRWIDLSSGPCNNVASCSYWSVGTIESMELDTSRQYMGRYDPSNGTVSAGNLYVWGPGNINQ